LESQKDSEGAVQAAKDMAGICLEFRDTELIITKKKESGDSLIKKGPYLLSANILTLGKDKAAILELSEDRLTFQVPRQGIFYLLKL